MVKRIQSEPLPAKAGRFDEPLKQHKRSASQFLFSYYFSPISKLSEWLRSCKSWFLMYSLIISSVTFPLLATKYPPAHRCWPQNCLFNSLYSICNFLDVLPFIYCTSLPADRFGGTDTSRCIWSLPTCHLYLIALTDYTDKLPRSQCNLSCYHGYPVNCYPYQIVFDIICAMGRFSVIFHIHHLKFNVSVLSLSKPGVTGLT